MGVQVYILALAGKCRSMCRKISQDTRRGPDSIEILSPMAVNVVANMGSTGGVIRRERSWTVLFFARELIGVSSLIDILVPSSSD